MRHCFRTLLVVFGCTLACNCAADESRDIMRRLLSNAELVILGEVESGGDDVELHEAASHASTVCRIRVIDVSKGRPPAGKSIRAVIDIVMDHPAFPKKGDKRVFFLRANNRDKPEYYLTNDIRFCIQPASMAAELKDLAKEMAAEQTDKPTP